MSPVTWRLCLAGAGNVGRSLIDLLDERGPDLAARYGVRLAVVGVAELGGAALHLDGLDLSTLRATLSGGRALADLPGVGRPGLEPLPLLAECGADILVEATPVNLTDGRPALDTVRYALTHGVHAVLANKAPLALRYAELAALSHPADRWPAGPAAAAATPSAGRLRFSATVAGALPVVTIGRRDLAGARIDRVEAIFNGTSQSVLRAMEAGVDFADAVRDAQRRGIAEADPSLDVGGHDAACKLAILANAVLGQPTALADIAVTGIDACTPADLAAARDRGERIVPLCLAERTDTGYHLAVRPAPLPQDHPLAMIGPDEMAVSFTTDRVDRLVAVSLEPGPEPAAAALLRDILDIAGAQPTGPTSGGTHAQ
ncbi:homoserine dehydrogenase [Micromonospora marina]|uniref:Homoserine dehydrogenase n=1 Tax=Micromonospora marina TaxID=307120 RepID=A0A1C4ZLY9_9ACTN|nr:homoserine dehydrogenase [Micromonospora marina]SCF33909.1 homoserine dehydrogenase [Micromonospora marina]